MFKILALDGGGIGGTFSAAVLDHFERQLGAPVISNFDSTVGTSTGGINAHRIDRLSEFTKSFEPLILDTYLNL